MSEWLANVKTLKMILFRTAADFRSWLLKCRNQGIKTGFVPTMGALHDGHMQLIRACRSTADICICSIFINPTQFNDSRDFEKYPVTLENDIEMLEKAGSDVIFLPGVAEIYPDGEKGLEIYDLGNLENVLEGQFRPGHFQGVCQVMSRLLGIIDPDHLFMGQKDYQQCLVIKRLIHILGLPVHFHTIPTIREADGLAQSSRNRRLTPDQRKNATAISRALNEIQVNLAPGSPEPLLKNALKTLERAHFKTDYVSISKADDLQPIQIWDGKEKAVALIAAFQGDIRLIDNILLN